LETGETEYKPVVRTSYNTADKLAVITAGNGAIIESTPSHPFYDIHSGWMKAEDLTASNQVVDKESNIVPVISVEFLEKETTVYNFEVLEHHNYFVSALGLLVHNVCDDAEKLSVFDEPLTNYESVEYGHKHYAPKNVDWDDVVDSTKNTAAKFKYGTDIESLQLKALEKGKIVNNGKPWVVYDCGEIIGAKYGIETPYIRVEVTTLPTGNVIHSHPITPQEYNRYIKVK